MSDHPTPPPLQDTPFVNEVRLGAGHWAVVFGVVALVMVLTPRVWKKIERFDSGPDYRIPYPLSKDYWLYERRIERLDGAKQVVVLGDSVMWGEYVRPDGTLSHFLNREAGETNRFVNASVNGLFPLALEGLVKHYGASLRGRTVLLHCNLLWLSSPKADLQVEQEGDVNHPRLLPQFVPRVPAYKADASDRLGASLERNIRFLSWIGHVQDAYFEQKNILTWTLADDGGNPPRRTNAYRNPLRQITLTVPAAPVDDPKRGPASRRHRPWTAGGEGPTRFEWVALERSLQWGAFQRLVSLLRVRGNNVLVLVGPFNEHMMTAENQTAYRKLRDGVAVWLAAQRVPHVVPDALPGLLYADASHPLTDGYHLLAGQLWRDAAFSAWFRQ
jgi:hypothetical protein